MKLHILKTKGIPTTLKNNNTIDIPPFDKAQTLNKHFANMSKVENPPHFPRKKN